MKLLKSLALISLMLLSFSASSQTLWGKASVGDSILDIKKKYPAGVDVDQSISGIGDLSYKYILKNISINDENFEAFFIFSKKYGLKSVHMKSTGDYNSIDCNIFTNKTLGALTAKYGKPDDAFGLSRFFIWKINGIQINFFANLGEGCIKINYESMKENISTDNL